MDMAESKRIYTILVLLCVLVSMNGVLLLFLLGWQITFVAVVFGLMLAMMLLVLTTSIE